jgi:hypothetical protein
MIKIEFLGKQSFDRCPLGIIEFAVHVCSLYQQGRNGQLKIVCVGLQCRSLAAR